MHWIGGIWSPGADAKLASKPYTLTRDFDAVLFFPTVTAEAPRRTAP
jgi:hypothetical protein